MTSKSYGGSTLACKFGRFEQCACALAVSAILLAIASPVACASDWMQFMRDNSHSSTTSDSGSGTYRVAWATPTGGRISASPACYDTDLDGKLEIAITSYDGRLYLINHDGTIQWQQTVGGQLGSSPAIGNIVGDASPEIIFGGSDGVYAYSSSGAKLWYFNTYSDVVSSPALCDIDSDGGLEVLIGASNGHLYAIEGTGTSLFDVVLDGSEILSSPACVNLNGDGIPDIVVGTAAGNVYGISNAGATLWSAPVNGPVYSSPSIRDMDTNGQQDIVVCSQYVMYAFDRLGVEMWNYSAADELWASPVLMDSNANNHGEAYIGTFGNRFICVENDALLWQTSLAGAVFSSAAICNVNGDGVKDLVFGDSSFALYALSSDTGAEIFHINLTDAIDSSPACCDIDADGLVEIITASVDGIVWCISSDSSTDHTCPAVSFGFPSDGSYVSGNVSVLVNPTDNVGITKVMLHYWDPNSMDWIFIGSDASAKDGFTFLWDTSALEKDIRYQLRALAFDAMSNFARATIEVLVKPPTIALSCDMSAICSPSLTEPTEGDIVTLSAEIGNMGPGDGSATLELYIDSVRLFIFNFTMRQGEMDRILVPWNTTGYSGDHVITAKVLNVNPVDADSSNNLFTVNISIAPAPPPPLPAADVYINSTEFSFSRPLDNITQNETCKIIVPVHNAGPNGVNARVNFVVFLGSMSAEKATIVGTTHVSVPSGGTSNASCDWIPANYGKYYVLASVEITSQHKDSNDNNNEAYTNVTVKVANTPPGDDDDNNNNNNDVVKPSSTGWYVPLIVALVIISIVAIFVAFWWRESSKPKAKQKGPQKGKYDGDLQQYRSYTAKKRNR